MRLTDLLTAVTHLHPVDRSLRTVPEVPSHLRGHDVEALREALSATKLEPGLRAQLIELWGRAPDDATARHAVARRWDESRRGAGWDVLEQAVADGEVTRDEREVLGALGEVRTGDDLPGAGHPRGTQLGAVSRDEASLLIDTAVLSPEVIGWLTRAHHSSVVNAGAVRELTALLTAGHTGTADMYVVFALQRVLGLPELDEKLSASARYAWHVFFSSPEVDRPSYERLRTERGMP